METSPFYDDQLPSGVSPNDSELEEYIKLFLHRNSETANLTDIIIHVHEGIVTLEGTVQTFNDIGRLYDMIYELNGVKNVKNELEVAD